jgi:guanosine-3',5'-bis(diphosphate) 3'-pyrophosphohydrolase
MDGRRGTDARTMARLTLVPAEPAPLAVSPLVRRAYAFAEHAHRGQRRKDGQAYISHPVRVARVLAGLGYGDDVVAAALLHDVVEDTPVSLAEVRQAFGARVAGLVDCVSEDMTLPGAERKRDYRERVRVGSREARAICAADKVCNLDDLRVAAAADDHVALQRFHGGLHAQARRFDAELAMLADAGVDPELLEALNHGVEALRAEARRLSVFHLPQHALAA